MQIKRKPEWLKVDLKSGSSYNFTSKILSDFSLTTVCTSAKCPNRGDCWARKSAAFMILGKNCTRACRFCAVDHSTPLAPDPQEPERLASAVRALGLKYVTITSVTRDDLPDFGAAHWAGVIREVKRQNSDSKIEVLVPDFCGETALIDLVLNEKPDVFNHNLETVRELQKPIRGKADYETSLKVLAHAAAKNFRVKSGLMLGLGERGSQIKEALSDLRSAGVKILSLGQYISPSPKHAPIDRWVRPEEFKDWKAFALSIGFEEVESAPLVRSSYRH